ncbi:hypothetical protein ACQQ2N_19780 [Dokdonella sp. MW10]|uniref:hypothetical protein n=1 Tax=Dokdonella sp. MW10 TaxID=2992926 RepID=UPI003F7DAEF8
MNHKNIINHLPNFSRDSILGLSLKAFVLSRIIVFSCLILPSLFNSAIEHEFRNVIIEFKPQKALDHLRDISRRNDAGWYWSIAEGGYEKRPFSDDKSANWAFFPGNPLLMSLASKFANDKLSTTIVINNLLFLISLYSIGCLASLYGLNNQSIKMAIFATAFFPTSYFFSLPWSESLFLFLSLACALAIKRKAWIYVAIFGYACAMTRFSGLFMVIYAATEIIRSEDARKIKPWIATCFIPLGLATFMGMLWHASGNPLAFSDIQTAWGRELSIPFRAIGIVILIPWEIAVDWNVRPLNLAALAIAVVAIAKLRSKNMHGMMFYVLLSALAPLMTGTLVSYSRYMSTLFPIHLMSKAMFGKTFWTVVIIVYTALLVFMTTSFSYGLSYAGA